MENWTAPTTLEEEAYAAGHRVIAGVDEAGRGPLAGPVVAGACVFKRGLKVPGVTDSKKLTPSQREELYSILTTHPDIHYAVAIVDHQRIDEINILHASLEAMAIAVQNLRVAPDFLLIDGNRLPPTKIASKAVVKGDSLSQSIAGASIIAKVERDRLMEEYHQKWPQYSFKQHKGYATKQHVQAIHQHGPCAIHRCSFEPVKSIVVKELTLTSPSK